MQVDHVARLLSRMLRGETSMIRRVPVPRGHDEIVMQLKPIDQGHDGIAFGHGQGPARQEIVLQVDEDQSVHGVIPLASRINRVLRSCSPCSRPTGYWCGLTKRLMPL